MPTVSDDELAFFIILTIKMAYKNAYLRYKVINRYLKDYGAASLHELKTACENALGVEKIGQRTIESDIHAMRYDDRLKFKAPIVYDAWMEKYKYKDEDYSIDKFPLNSEELQNLKFAASILSQYDHISYLQEFQGVVQKIVDAVNVRRMQEEESEFRFIDFEKAPITKGNEYLEKLVDHIRCREVIELTYKAFTTDESTICILHPYLLKEYRNRWYLVAWNEEDNMIKIYGLERIEDIRQLFNKRFREQDIDAEKYFRHTIGITVTDKDPEEIIVAFSPFQAKYLVTQPIHSTQELLEQTDEQGRHHFRFKLIPTFEFTALLMGWVDEVEVIIPAWYREEVKDKVEKMGRMYQDN
jgi:predicted DNA-binding transcriptional regulator YafY